MEFEKKKVAWRCDLYCACSTGYSKIIIKKEGFAVFFFFPKDSQIPDSINLLWKFTRQPDTVKWLYSVFWSRVVPSGLHYVPGF